ncbi:MAG: hypothetical protein J7J22_00385, partial [Candidatus Verstraetearchaeota archaeon]|nr:hypothetical protein [Candidatus Verstraetearchaeota archaeon]
DSRLAIHVLSSAFDLDRLSDVTISSPSDNQILAYDAGSGKWTNQTSEEAGVLASDGSVPLTGDWDIGGFRISNLKSLNFKDATTLTISSGAITVSQSYHYVDTEGGASTDDLDTINGGMAGDILYLRSADSARTVVIKHGTGNIVTPDGSDYSLDSTDKVVALLCDGTNWHLILAGGGAAANPGGTDGQIQYNDGGSFGGAADLYWDDANSRLGIGKSSPDQRLEIAGDTPDGGAPVGFALTSLNVGDQFVFTLRDRTTATGTVQHLQSIYDSSAGVWRQMIRADIDTATLRIGDTNWDTLTFRTASTDRMTIDSGGSVGIGTTSPGYTLDVSGDIHCTGKLTSDGGNDPPYVLYNYESRASIIDRVKKEVLPDKLNGAVLFFNGDRGQLELFLPSKGEFRSLDGRVLETVKPITQTFETEDRYYFDENTGEIRSYKVKKLARKYRLKPDHELDPLTGKVKRKIKEKKKDSKTGEKIEEIIGEEEVSLEEAIELVEAIEEDGG